MDHLTFQPFGRGSTPSLPSGPEVPPLRLTHRRLNRVSEGLIWLICKRDSYNTVIFFFSFLVCARKITGNQKEMTKISHMNLGSWARYNHVLHAGFLRLSVSDIKRREAREPAPRNYWRSQAALFLFGAGPASVHRKQPSAAG